MSVTLPEKTVVYPDSDGERMADNTKQADFMVFLKTNFDATYADRPDVFVAMDLLWYPVEGRPEIRVAPDVMLAFGRPKGDRGSYMQWREGDVAPQVVIEILSPGNRLREMSRKLEFYDEYGVEEYYVYDPDDFEFSGWHRPAHGERLRLIHPMENWVSPRLGIRFDAPGDRPVTVYGPDGKPYRSPLAIVQELATAERERDKLAAKLRELGIDPTSL